MSSLRATAGTAAALVLVTVVASAAEDCPEPEVFDMRTFMEDTVGTPVSHNDTWPAGTELQTVCHDRFCVGHNSFTRQPDWVVERINRSIACGDNDRPSGWKEEKAVAPQNRATDADYTGSGYARGHNAASADFKSDLDWMKQTFVFSNAVPQLQNGFNGSYWRFLEDDVQKLALSGADLVVITGPIPADPGGRKITVSKRRNACGRKLTLAGLSTLKKLRICNANDTDPSVPCENDAGVSVPAGMFKIIHIPDLGRTFAFVMSNEDHGALHTGDESNDEYIDHWLTTVDVIERLTNLEFFTHTPPGERSVDKEACTESRWRM